MTSREDTPSFSPKRQNRVTAVSHLLIGIGLFILLIFTLTIIAFFAFDISLNPESGSLDFISQFKDRPEAFKVLNFLSTSLPMFLAAILAVVAIKANPQKYLLIQKPNNWKFVVLSLVFFVAAMPLMGPLFELNSLINFDIFGEGTQKWLMEQDEQNNKAYGIMSQGDGIGSLLSMLFFMAVVPAIAEEFFFRGFLMNVAHGMFKNMHYAILFSAIVFTGIHMQFMKVLPMLLLAVTFGYLVYWTNSIWTAVIAHLLNNAIAVWQLRFSVNGDYSELLNQEKSSELYIVIPCLLISIGLFYYLQKNAKPKALNFYE